MTFEERNAQLAQRAVQLLGHLGYTVELGFDFVEQQGSRVRAPEAPHFVWHELGHALTYLGDADPRTPVESWFPLPAWLEALGLPEQEADKYADACAEHMALLTGSRIATLSVVSVERLQLFESLPNQTWWRLVQHHRRLAQLLK